MPKWVKGAALAVLGAVMLTALLVVIIPRLPQGAPTEPSVPEIPAYYELSVRTEYNSLRNLYTIDYQYDENGNLTEVCPQSLLSSSLPLKTKFLYDSDGVLVELRQVRDYYDFDEILTVGTVTYEENQVLVRLTNADGSNPRTAVFRYDSDGRIKGFEFGGYTYALEYTEQGNIQRLNMQMGNAELDGYTWIYGDDGHVTNLRRDLGGVYSCTCDERGNVVSECSLNIVPEEEGNTDYKTITVSRQIARQYELQQYVLYALRITPVGTLHPVIKTPLD